MTKGIITALKTSQQQQRPGPHVFSFEVQNKYRLFKPAGMVQNVDKLYFSFVQNTFNCKIGDIIFSEIAPCMPYTTDVPEHRVKYRPTTILSSAAPNNDEPALQRPRLLRLPLRTNYTVPPMETTPKGQGISSLAEGFLMSGPVVANPQRPMTFKR